MKINEIKQQILQKDFDSFEEFSVWLDGVIQRSDSEGENKENKTKVTEVSCVACGLKGEKKWFAEADVKGSGEYLCEFCREKHKEYLEALHEARIDENGYDDDGEYWGLE